MTIKMGSKIPDATLMEMGEAGPQPVRTSDVFSGKTVALFAVPGAFTPTCSAKHLPSFIEQSSALAEKGIDEIVCTSVNDVFVMDAWSKQADPEGKVRMLADGNGAFAEALGLEMDASGFGMGKRSKRYSLLVRDGTVEKVNIEQGGSYEVSSGDYLLKQL